VWPRMLLNEDISQVMMFSRELIPIVFSCVLLQHCYHTYGEPYQCDSEQTILQWSPPRAERSQAARGQAESSGPLGPSSCRRSTRTAALRWRTGSALRRG
jgi:hypothetical protein